MHNLIRRNTYFAGGGGPDSILTWDYDTGEFFISNDGINFESIGIIPPSLPRSSSMWQGQDNKLFYIASDNNNYCLDITSLSLTNLGTPSVNLECPVFQKDIGIVFLDVSRQPTTGNPFYFSHSGNVVDDLTHININLEGYDSNDYWIDQSSIFKYNDTGFILMGPKGTNGKSCMVTYENDQLVTHFYNGYGSIEGYSMGGSTKSIYHMLGDDYIYMDNYDSDYDRNYLNKVKLEFDDNYKINLTYESCIGYPQNGILYYGAVVTNGTKTYRFGDKIYGDYNYLLTNGNSFSIGFYNSMSNNIINGHGDAWYSPSNMSAPRWSKKYNLFYLENRNYNLVTLDENDNWGNVNGLNKIGGFIIIE